MMFLICKTIVISRNRQFFILFKKWWFILKKYAWYIWIRTVLIFMILVYILLYWIYHHEISNYKKQPISIGKWWFKKLKKAFAAGTHTLFLFIYVWKRYLQLFQNCFSNQRNWSSRDPLFQQKRIKRCFDRFGLNRQNTKICQMGVVFKRRYM